MSSSIPLIAANMREVNSSPAAICDAADRGVANSQYFLGVDYYDGRGVPQDYTFAHMWLNLAAAQGMAFAASKRAEVEAKMSPAQIAEAQRLAREWKPTN
jgi:TPR repeat protein